MRHGISVSYGFIFLACRRPNAKLYVRVVEYGIQAVFDYVCKFYRVYELYKRSVPDKEMKYAYFKALSKEELTDYDLVFGLERYVIKSILEGYVCLAIASGILKWEDETKWFWQSENDPDLIVLKKWFVQ